MLPVEDRTPRRTAADLRSIRWLHTLGPSGTNLENASYEWFARRNTQGQVVLHPSLESAMEVVPATGEHALMACAVYPDLHTLTFSNLGRLAMVDSFVMPTHNMVLAGRTDESPETVSTHPAPSGLVPPNATRRFVLSNSQAAVDCAAGITDACITTSVAAQANSLRTIQDFGPVPMVFTVHQVLALGEAR